MDKLIKYLNEYKSYTDHKRSIMSEYVWANVGDDIVMDSYVGTTEDKTLEIISKKFGFIKWLVDNDKIDKEKVWKNESPDIFDYSFYEVVLMLLAISDTPIEDLISYLHE